MPPVNNGSPPLLLTGPDFCTRFFIGIPMTSYDFGACYHVPLENAPKFRPEANGTGPGPQNQHKRTCFLFPCDRKTHVFLLSQDKKHVFLVTQNETHVFLVTQDEKTRFYSDSGKKHDFFKEFWDFGDRLTG